MVTFQILDIIAGTTVDGPGLRTSIYFAGCEHKCHDCHNPQSWNAKAGVSMDVDDVMKQIIENDFNVTFSGGDPMLQVDNLIELAKRVKSIGKNIWCYTGYTYEEVLNSNKLKTILPYIDVLVDGRYEKELRDTELLFRGSSNQRLIDVTRSLESGSVVIWTR